jgi:hypothetical protein
MMIQVHKTIFEELINNIPKYNIGWKRLELFNIHY